MAISAIATIASTITQARPFINLSKLPAARTHTHRTKRKILPEIAIPNMSDGLLRRGVLASNVAKITVLALSYSKLAIIVFNS